MAHTTDYYVDYGIKCKHQGRTTTLVHAQAYLELFQAANKMKLTNPIDFSQTKYK